MPIATLFLVVLLMIVAGVIPTLPYVGEIDFAAGGLADALLAFVFTLMLLIRD